MKKVLAGLLVVLGVLTERWNVTIPGILGHAHLPYTSGGYAPTASEVTLTGAVYVVGLLTYAVLLSAGAGPSGTTAAGAGPR